jgi:hypothetical protein
MASSSDAADLGGKELDFSTLSIGYSDYLINRGSDSTVKEKVISGNLNNNLVVEKKYLFRWFGTYRLKCIGERSKN